MPSLTLNHELLDHRERAYPIEFTVTYGPERDDERITDTRCDIDLTDDHFDLLDEMAAEAAESERAEWLAEFADYRASAAEATVLMGMVA